MTLLTYGEVSQEVIKGENIYGAPRGGFHQSKKIIFFYTVKKGSKRLGEAVDVYRAPPDRSREDKPLWPDEVARIGNLPGCNPSN
jgi:hypothetical protein